MAHIVVLGAGTGGLPAAYEAGQLLRRPDLVQDGANRGRRRLASPSTRF